MVVEENEEYLELNYDNLDKEFLTLADDMQDEEGDLA